MEKTVQGTFSAFMEVTVFSGKQKAVGTKVGFSNVSKNLRATNQLWRQEMMGIQWDKSQEVGQNVEVLSWFLRPTGDGE